MKRPKKNNHRYKRRIALTANYWNRHSKWRDNEPSMLRIFAWLRWKSEEPKKPKWLKEQELGWWWRYGK